MRDLGYVEGQNIAILWQNSEGYDRLRSSAAQLARLNVDVIVTFSTPAALAAKGATATIPIVMAISGDPVGDGLVAGLARPAGNVTGLSTLAPELSAKRLELLKEAVPGSPRVALLWNPNTPFHKTMLKEIEAAAPALGVQPQPVEARGPNEFERAFATMTSRRASALLVFDDAMFGENESRIIARAAKNRLPTIFGSRHYVDAGGLMSYGPHLPDMFRRAAVYVDKILRGAKPGDLPIEQPTKFELIINLKTAKALGLTIPQSVLLRADRVIR